MTSLVTLHVLTIQRFGSRASRRFFERGDERHIGVDHRETVRDILARLNASVAPEDMDLPGFLPHRLKGDYAGFRAVTARANRRIIFRFQGGHAVEVDYVDQH